MLCGASLLRCLFTFAERRVGDHCGTIIWCNSRALGVEKRINQLGSFSTRELSSCLFLGKAEWPTGIRKTEEPGALDE